MGGAKAPFQYHIGGKMKRQIIVVDFETYYDDTYTLSGQKYRHTTEEYIRSPKFEAQGVAIKVGDAPAVFYRGDEIAPRLHELRLDSSDVITVCHNAAFDVAILSWVYNIIPANIVCTEVMAWVSGAYLLTNGTSLKNIAWYLNRRGVACPLKGTALQDMKGRRLQELSDEDWVAYADYATGDVEITRIVYEYLKQYIPPADWKMIDLTIRMGTEPTFEVDLPRVRDYIARLTRTHRAMMTNTAKELGYPTRSKLLSHVRSAVYFAQILERLGVNPPMKPSPKVKNADGTAKMIPAFAKTDVEFVALLGHDDPRVVSVCEARLTARSTIAISRGNKFKDIGTRGRLPMALRFNKAHTGRYAGSGGINVQNLPKRQGDTTLRKVMCAPQGELIVAADSSQIEARINAYVSGEKELLEVFRTNGDPYSLMGGKIFGVPADEVYRLAKVEQDKHGIFMRNVGKEAVLACGYQMGWKRFSVTLEQKKLVLPDAMTPKDVVDAYRASAPYISAMWRTLDRVIARLAAGEQFYFGGPTGELFYADGIATVLGVRVPSIRLPNGYFLRYYELKWNRGDPYGFWTYKGTDVGADGVSTTPRTVTLSGGKLLGNLCQSSAFAVMKYQALEVTKATGVRPILNVHDEWVYSVPREDAAQMVVTVAKSMRSVPDWLAGCPLDCEVSVGRNYGEMKDLKV